MTLGMSLGVHPLLFLSAGHCSARCAGAESTVRSSIGTVTCSSSLSRLCCVSAPDPAPVLPMKSTRWSATAALLAAVTLAVAAAASSVVAASDPCSWNGYDFRSATREQEDTGTANEANAETR